MISLTIIQVITYSVALFVLSRFQLPGYFMVIFIVINILLSMYTFRFQRTTLSIARNMGAHGITNQGNVQLLLTPNYLGYISYLNVVIGACAFALIVFSTGWVYAIIYLLLTWLGLGITDIFIPFPTYKHCLDLIEKHLNSEVRSKRNIELLAISIQLLGEVNEARQQLVLGKFKG